MFDNTTHDLDLTVKDSVAPKPDAVKRCEFFVLNNVCCNNEILLVVYNVVFCNKEIKGVFAKN